MEGKISIEYNFNRNDDSDEPIKPSHLEALQEDAEERIFEMIKEGYYSGELHTYVLVDDEDGEDGISYSGWFTITKSVTND